MPPDGPRGPDPRTIETVSYPIGSCELQVVVRDPPYRRVVRLEWVAKEGSPLPPQDWVAAVFGECDYQNAQELAQSKGLPDF